MIGENFTVANFYGAVNHNTFSSSGSISAFQYIGAVNPSPPPSPAGTAKNLFFEDNTTTVTTMTDAGLGCIDGWGGHAIVYRHNIDELSGDIAWCDARRGSVEHSALQQHHHGQLGICQRGFFGLLSVLSSSGVWRILCIQQSLHRVRRQE